MKGGGPVLVPTLVVAGLGLAVIGLVLGFVVLLELVA